MISIAEAPTYHFMGGLGDVIRRCYLTESMVHLEDLTDTVNVLVGSGNVYAQELFWWHRNREHLRILPASHLWQQIRLHDKERPTKEILEEFYAFFGIPLEREVHCYLDSENPARPTFYPSQPIHLPPRSVIVQPGSRGPKRVLDEAMAMQMIETLADMDLEVFIITRLEEPPRGIQRPNVHFCSPPAPDTLCMLQQADAFLGSHSALTQLAWFERKPAFIVYPDQHPEWITEHRFTFGKDYETTYGVPFSEFRPELVQQFVREFIPA